jgi:hypothetical protein
MVAPAHAQVTSLVVVSDHLDFVGAGQMYTHTPADGTFTATYTDGSIEIRFRDHDEPYPRYWNLTFQAPTGQPLTPGEYDGATSMRTPQAPGLLVSGQGRGCDAQGSFHVREFVAGPGSSVESFRATFEQHCDGLPPALRGEIRFNATVPIELTAPLLVITTAGQTVSFDVGATDLAGGPVVLEAFGLPAGATFIDRGDGTGQFSWQTPSDLPGEYGATFVARSLAAHSESVETRIRLTPTNDAFSAAAALPGPGSALLVYGSTHGATAEAGEPWPTNLEPRSVWFKWVAPSSDRIVLETADATFRSRLVVYADSTPQTPPSLESLERVAQGEAFWDNKNSKAIFTADAGRTYLIAVSNSYQHEAGTFRLLMRRGELTRALWRHTSGAISLWSVDTSGQIVSAPQYGPFAGWEALRLGVAPDGTTRVLWRNVTGSISLWHLNGDGSLAGSRVFGPYAGWEVSDLAIDVGGAIHLSWRHSSGALGLWHMAPSGSIESSLVFGPYPGWHVVALSAGPVRHTLWRGASNTTGLWTQYDSYGAPYVTVHGPGAAWTPVDVAPFVHNQAWILSRAPDGAAKVWSSPSAAGSYGPYPGWLAVAVTAPNVFDADTGARILWKTDDGRAAIWHVHNAAEPPVRNFAYGPFPGWTVIDVAAGPD